MRSRRFSGILFACVLAVLRHRPPLLALPSESGRRPVPTDRYRQPYLRRLVRSQIRIVPGGEHKSGEMVISTTSCATTQTGPSVKKVGEIPQVEKTYTYFHTATPS